MRRSLPDELVLVTDGRYGDQAAAQMAAAGVDGARRWSALTGAAIDDCSPTRVGAVRPRSASRPTHVTYAAVPAPTRRRSTPDARRPRRRGRGRAARRRTPARSPAWPRPAASPTPRWPTVAPLLGRRADRGRGRATSSRSAMRELGAERPELRDDRRHRPDNAALPAPPPDGRARSRTGDTVVIDVGALYDGYHSRHDPHASSSASRSRAAARAVRRSSLEAQAAGRRRRRAPGVSTPDARRGVPRHDHRPPATATGSPTAPATASAC